MSPGQCKTNYSEMQELIVNIFSVLFHYEGLFDLNLYPVLVLIGWW